MNSYKVIKSVTTKLGNVIELISDNLSTFQPFNHSTALVIGVFHGDEPQGKFLIEEYLKKQDAYPPLEGGSKSLISGWGNHKYSKELVTYAKELRNNPTLHEKILWKYLRKSQFLNLKFRRQQPIGPYIVDFMCCNPKIIIELDGGQHNYDENIEYDKERDKFLNNQGYRVIRIWNNDISKNIQGVLMHLKNEIMNPTPKSEISTLPQGEGGHHAHILPCINENIEYLEREINNPTPKSKISTLPLAQTSTGSLGSAESQGEGGHSANILFIPCLNPDGMALGTRTNANGVDLNRNFPTKNWGEDNAVMQLGSYAAKLDNSENSQVQQIDTDLSPYRPIALSPDTSNINPYFGGESAGSEIETQFVMKIIDEYKPEKILTLHAPYKVVNYDGPARDWAESVSKIINYPVEESIGYPTPGSFGTYAGVERNIPVITLELDEEIPTEQLIPPVFEIFDNL